MKIAELASYLESLAPLSFQEDYDNCGLLTGDPEWQVSGVLLTLDVTREVVEEAIANHCNLVIAHHPVIFKGLKKLTDNQSDTIPVILAVRNQVAIYAIHTNLDNLYDGLNAFILTNLGASGFSVLRPIKGQLRKLVTFCPQNYTDNVRDALFSAGAGCIGNYDSCSFNLDGTGTFRGSDETNPFVGLPNVLHHEKETRIEVIYPAFLESKLLKVLKDNHPYEEVAYDIYPLLNDYHMAGSGLTGILPEPEDEQAFLLKIRERLQTGGIRHSVLRGKPVSKIGVCTGAGSFLINDALRAGVDLFITADMKYHDFFSGLHKMVVADVGHYESEQWVKAWLRSVLIKKFPNFAFLISKIDTNPIKYL